MRFESEPSDSAVPLKRPAKFVFDASQSEDFYNDLLTKYRKLNGRITNLMDAATVDNHPFIKYIFQTVRNPDPAELTRLGNALNLIADLYPILQKLSAQINFIEFARANPDIAELAFCDAGSAIEDLDTWLREQTS